MNRLAPRLAPAPALALALAGAPPTGLAAQAATAVATHGIAYEVARSPTGRAWSATTCGATASRRLPRSRTPVTTTCARCWTGGAAADAARAMALDNAALWSMDRLERPLDPPALDRLESIAAPTLVVVGERDLPQVFEVAGLLEARIPGAERVVVPGAGHLVNLDAPAALARALASFLPRGRAPDASERPRCLE
jgi:pimeloyl-ACP methyl ester carboxylesterase